MKTDSSLPYLVHFSEVDPKQTLIAHIEGGKVFFMQERLQKIMQNYGINIPPNERKDYGGESIVYLKNEGDDVFETAFRQIYYKLHLPKNEYQWVDVLTS